MINSPLKGKRPDKKHEEIEEIERNRKAKKVLDLFFCVPQHSLQNASPNISKKDQ
jgi:hypothetical protein